MMTTRRPLERVARRTFGSAGTCASTARAIKTNAAAAAPIRRSGRNQPGYFICLPSIRRQVRDQRRLIVDLLQRLGDRSRRDDYAAVLRFVEAKGAAEAVDVAVEHRADHLRMGVDRGRARVSADDVVVGREVEYRVGTERALRRNPFRRQRERILSRRTLIKAAEIGERLHRRAILVPAF